MATVHDSRSGGRARRGRRSSGRPACRSEGSGSRPTPLLRRSTREPSRSDCSGRNRPPLSPPAGSPSALSQPDDPLVHRSERNALLRSAAAVAIPSPLQSVLDAVARPEAVRRKPADVQTEIPTGTQVLSAKVSARARDHRPQPRHRKRIGRAAHPGLRTARLHAATPDHVPCRPPKTRQGKRSPLPTDHDDDDAEADRHRSRARTESFSRWTANRSRSRSDTAPRRAGRSPGPITRRLVVLSVRASCRAEGGTASSSPCPVHLRGIPQSLSRS